MKLIDLTGQTFDRIVVLRRGENAKRQIKWICRCECGKEFEAHGQNLRSGATRSCGCLRSDLMHSKMIQDGRSAHPLYQLWRGILDRCGSRSPRVWASYGGRGIRVHEAWIQDFWAFVTWMNENLGPKPEGHSLDRIDNDGHYAPGNLRWASASEQIANTRPKISNAQFDEAVVEINLWRQRALDLGWVE